MAFRNLKGIVEKVEIRGRMIGIADIICKIAVLSPKESVRKQEQLEYDRLVSELQNKGYKILNSSSEKPKKLAGNKFYDIFEGLWR